MASNTDSAPAAKRKRPNTHYDKIRDLVDSVGEGTDHEVLKIMLMNIRELLDDEAEGNTSPKKPKLEASYNRAFRHRIFITLTDN